MRYIRTILDVICYHDKTHVSSTSSQILVPSSLIFDVARLKNHDLIYKQENISDEARLYFDDNRIKLQRIASGVVRLHLPSGSCSGFYIGIGLIGTNEHNISQIKSSSSFTKTNDIYSTPSLLKQCTAITNNDSDFASARTNIMFLNVVETTVFDPNKNSNIRECHIEQDPVLGITGDFDMIDFDVVKETEKVRTNNTILFVPSTQHVQVNDPIVTISYPGNESSIQQSSGRRQYDIFLPPFKEVKEIFHGFGGRCVSYGRVIAPYKLNESLTEWSEDLEYRNIDFSNYQCIISNENLYHGSSGGVTMKSNFEIYENVPTTTNEAITLVEFISIHFGGEFIPCRDCLSHVIPSNRVEIGPDDIQLLHGCKACINNKQIPVSYNYGVSVHHVAFQEYYRQQKQYYLELFGGNLPKPLTDYYELHHM